MCGLDSLRKQTKSNFTGRGRNASSSFFNVLVRTSMRPDAAQAIVRGALDKIDKQTPILQPNTLDAIVRQSLGQQRLTMELFGAFAGVALLLAIVGIYGAVAYTVEQQTPRDWIHQHWRTGHRCFRLVVKQGIQFVVWVGNRPSASAWRR